MFAKFKNILALTRISTPYGFLLLLWTCLTGLFLGYDVHSFKFTHLVSHSYPHIIFFIFACILGRSFGCVVNDICDRKIDAQVERTKNRPLANGSLSLGFAIFIAVFLGGCGAVMFYFLDLTQKIIFLSSAPFILSYPLFKRFFPIPQLILGITFNFAFLIGFFEYYSVQSWQFSYFGIGQMGMIYVAMLLWTIAYDTAYAMGDREEDAKNGLKSATITFGKYSHYFIKGFMYAVAGIFIAYNAYFKANIYAFAPIFIWHVINLVFLEKKKYDTLFKANAIFGFLLPMSILV